MAQRRRAKGVDTGEMESAGGMRWLLTYADLITLLLAMFIILWITASQDTTKFKVVMEAFQRVFGAKSLIKQGGTTMMGGGQKGGPIPKFTPLIPLGKKMDILADYGKEQAKKEGVSGDVKFERTERGFEIILQTEGTKPLFQRGDADISPGYKTFLDNIVAMLKASGQPVRIEGHTCNLPISTAEFPSNWELSTRRATNILRYFIQKGFPKEKLSAAGYADTRWVALNTTEENRKKNRRVEIIILSKSAQKLEPEAQKIEKLKEP